MTTPLEEYGRMRSEVKDVLDGMVRAARALDLVRDARVLDDLVSRVQEGLLKIIVIGEFNRGKSTFINALLGRNVLPTAVRPTTATLNIIQWGDAPRAKVTFQDGSVEDVGLEGLEQYVTVKGAEAPRVKFVEIFYPTRFCERGVRIIDTPGVNDLDKQREEVTYSFIPGSDAAILVLDGEAAVSRSEKVFLEEKILKNDISKIFLVLNKIDQLDAGDLDEVVEYARGKLGEIVPESRLFPLSARDALKAKTEGDDELFERTGMRKFEKALGEFLVSDRGKAVLLVPIGRAQRIGKRLLTAAALRRESLSLEIAELEEKLQRVEPVLEQHASVKKSIEKRVKKASAELARQFESKIREGLADICRDMKQVVDESAIEPEFVKDILPDLLRRKIVRLLEDNREKIVERLSGLERRVLTEVGQLLEELDTVVYREFSFEKQKSLLEELRLTKTGQKQELLMYEVGPFVAGSVLGFISMSIMGIIGLIPGFLGGIFIKDMIEDRHQGRLRQDLKKALDKLMNELEKRLVTETSKGVEGIALDISSQLAAQLDDSARSLRKTMESMRKERAEAEKEGEVLGRRLSAVEEDLGRLLGRLEEQETLLKA